MAHAMGYSLSPYGLEKRPCVLATLGLPHIHSESAIPQLSCPTPTPDRRWLSAAHQGLRIPEGEIGQQLPTELAIALYAQGVLSLGKAAELAEMNRMLFGEMVGQRGIARHYGDAELAQDVSYARSE